MDEKTREDLMRVAIKEASSAIERGDEPFGGVICNSEGYIIVRNGNRENTGQDPVSHAETVLIREASKVLDSKGLSGYILVCNAEACPMCASAAVLSGIREFYYGADMEPFCNPYIRMRDVLMQAKGNFTLVEGVLKDECASVVQEGRKRSGK